MLIKYRIAFALLILLATPFAARATFFETANTLRTGHFGLGLEPLFTFDPSDFVFNIHGGYGLTPALDMELTLGLGHTIYFGGDLKFALIPDSRRTLGVSIFGGAHGADNFGLDLGLILSKQFHTFAFYGGLDTDIEFIEAANDTSVVIPLNVNLGLAVPVSRQADFYFEAQIGATDSASSGIGGGLMFYF